MNTLLVLGASGEMLRRVVRLARSLLPGVRVVEASRHPDPGDPDRRRVDIHDHGSLRRALEDVDAVINAVGPFDYDPTPTVTACIESGCHYIDLAETGAHLNRVRNPCSRSRSVEWPDGTERICLDRPLHGVRSSRKAMSSA